MQSPPLLRCSRAAAAAPLAVLRMLASSPSSKPNPNHNHYKLDLAMKNTTCEPSKTSSLAIPLMPPNQNGTSNPSIPYLTQRLPSPRCFSSAAATKSAMAGKEVLSSCESERSSLLVLSFYKFADFPDHAELRKPLKELCEELRVSGGIILAPEGINGSICGTRESVERVLEYIQSDSRLKGLKQIESPVTPEDEAIHHGHTSSSPVGAGEDAPFRWDHVRVKLKKEIVSLGLPSVSPVERKGKYVSPQEWNELISSPDTVVIDVRNTYETRIGKFKGAVDPKTTAFREFPSWVENELPSADLGGQPSPVEAGCSSGNANGQPVALGRDTPPRVAMYCTGGIRCEKASSYLLSKGFKEVYHLKGGILKYLEEIPRSESLWEGECFVFDKRVSVEHGLVPGTYKLCYGCKQPVSDADMESPEYEFGVSCPHCFSTKSEEEKERARARQRQFRAWGVIGGPDKGRRPAQKNSNDTRGGDSQLSKSI